MGLSIGIYGGSFNPVHYGHIQLAQWVLAHSELDEIWMMVSPNNPLKEITELADEQIRLRALQQRLQQEGIERIKASDFEFSLSRPSYTANTLRALRATYPDHQFSLIIGEDNWQLFDQWKEYSYILRTYPIYVYPRHSAAPKANEPCYERGAKQVIYMNGAPYFDISSTEIREKNKKTLYI